MANKEVNSHRRDLRAAQLREDLVKKGDAGNHALIHRSTLSAGLWRDAGLDAKSLTKS